MKLNDVVDDTLDRRRMWPKKPEDILLGPDDVKDDEESPWVRMMSLEYVSLES